MDGGEKEGLLCLHSHSHSLYYTHNNHNNNSPLIKREIGKLQDVLTERRNGLYSCNRGKACGDKADQLITQAISSLQQRRRVFYGTSFSFLFFLFFFCFGFVFCYWVLFPHRFLFVCLVLSFVCFLSFCFLFIVIVIVLFVSLLFVVIWY